MLPPPPRSTPTGPLFPSTTLCRSSHGAGAQALGNVAVQPIEGKGGWLVRNALNDRLAAMRGTGPGYRLVVKLDDNISGFGLRSDAAITRERRSLRARDRKSTRLNSSH